MSVLLWKLRNAGASDKQITFLVPKIGTQNETLDSDIEERYLGKGPATKSDDFLEKCQFILQILGTLNRVFEHEIDKKKKE